MVHRCGHRRTDLHRLDPPILRLIRIDEGVLVRHHAFGRYLHRLGQPIHGVRFPDRPFTGPSDQQRSLRPIPFRTVTGQPRQQILPILLRHRPVIRPFPMDFPGNRYREPRRHLPLFHLLPDHAGVPHHIRVTLQRERSDAAIKVTLPAMRLDQPGNPTVIRHL